MYETPGAHGAVRQLTHLPNRQLFLDRLKTALARARGANERCCRCCSLTWTASGGERHAGATPWATCCCSGWLSGCSNAYVRPTPWRGWGDEFVVLVEGGQAREHALQRPTRSSQPFVRDFDLEGQRLYIQPSIGAAIYPEHGGEEHRLLGHADEAMYLSKRNGGNQVRVALAPCTPDTPEAPDARGPNRAAAVHARE